MTDTPTPLTDAKERETERTANSLLGAKRHAHYGWKHARTLERRLRVYKRALKIATDVMSEYLAFTEIADAEKRIAAKLGEEG